MPRSVRALAQRQFGRARTPAAPPSGVTCPTFAEATAAALRALAVKSVDKPARPPPYTRRTVRRIAACRTDAALLPLRSRNPPRLHSALMAAHGGKPFAAASKIVYLLSFEDERIIAYSRLQCAISDICGCPQAALQLIILEQIHLAERTKHCPYISFKFTSFSTITF